MRTQIDTDAVLAWALFSTNVRTVYLVLWPILFELYNQSNINMEIFAEKKLNFDLIKRGQEI